MIIVLFAPDILINVKQTGKTYFKNSETVTMHPLFLKNNSFIVDTLPKRSRCYFKLEWKKIP